VGPRLVELCTHLFVRRGVELLVEVVVPKEVVVVSEGHLVQLQTDCCRERHRDGDSVLVDELLRGINGLLDGLHCLSFRRMISHYMACISCERKKESPCGQSFL
jgi:hypothetical protein